jgi:cytochrome c oxidase subunit IV
MAASNVEEKRHEHTTNSKVIWRTFWILFIVTALEFLVAFTLPHDYKVLRIGIFIAMTIVKAFYIVSEFMHLKHEVKTLVWSILIPMIFVVWLIIALLVEGGSVFQVRY